MRSSGWLPLIAVATLGLGSCDTKVSSVTNPEMLARIQVIKDCLPNLWTFADGLVQVSGAWKMNGGTIPDPVGLTKTVNGDGSITVSLSVGATTIDMAVRFYGPNGAEQDLSSVITSPTTLGDKIDAAASELRDRFGEGEKFIHGVYSISGGGIEASGEALTGIIGGVLNDNELEEVRSTVVTVTSGIPMVDSTTILDNASSPPCTLTFSIPSLVTDEEPGQEYPSGTISSARVDGTTTASASIIFDKTSTARVTLDGLVGGLDFNLDTLTLQDAF